MDISRADLESRYKLLSNNELLDIYANRQDYTPVAIEVARNEIEQRQLGDDDLNNFIAYKVIEADEQYQRQHFRELYFLEKLFFYYLALLVFGFWIAFAWLSTEVESDGYKVKVYQGKLFLTFGAVFLLSFAFESGFYVWLLGFAVPYYFDYQDSKERKEMYERIYGNPFISED